MKQAEDKHNSKKLETIRNSVKFSRLVKRRNSIRFFLSALVIILHAFFIGGIAFYNDWFASPFFSNNSIIPNGIYYAVFVIVMMLALEFIYIFISDHSLNQQQEEVLEEDNLNEIL